MRKTDDERGQMVVKANALIQHSRYSLTLQQHKLLLYFISKIKPDDAVTTWYTADIKDICRVCGITMHGGYYHATIKQDLLKMTERSYGIMPNGETWTLSWLGDVRWSKGSTMVSVIFSPTMTPFLFALRAFYTQYPLEWVLALKTVYGLRLLELLLSYIYQSKLNRDIPQDVVLPLEQIRNDLDASAYSKWYDLDRYAIAKAVADINKYSPDIHVTYKPRKTGRSVSAVVFTVEQPTPIAALTASRNRREELDGY